MLYDDEYGYPEFVDISLQIDGNVYTSTFALFL